MLNIECIFLELDPESFEMSDNKNNFTLISDVILSATSFKIVVKARKIFQLIYPKLLVLQVSIHS